MRVPGCRAISSTAMPTRCDCPAVKKYILTQEGYHLRLPPLESPTFCMLQQPHNPQSGSSRCSGTNCTGPSSPDGSGSQPAASNAWYFILTKKNFCQGCFCRSKCAKRLAIRLVTSISRDRK